MAPHDDQSLTFCQRFLLYYNKSWCTLQLRTFRSYYEKENLAISSSVQPTVKCCTNVRLSLRGFHASVYPIFRGRILNFMKNFNTSIFQCRLVDWQNQKLESRNSKPQSDTLLLHQCVFLIIIMKRHSIIYLYIKIYLQCFVIRSKKRL